MNYQTQIFCIFIHILLTLLFCNLPEMDLSRSTQLIYNLVIHLSTFIFLCIKQDVTAQMLESKSAGLRGFWLVNVLLQRENKGSLSKAIQKYSG